MNDEYNPSFPTTQAQTPIASNVTPPLHAGLFNPLPSTNITLASPSSQVRTALGYNEKNMRSIDTPRGKYQKALQLMDAQQTQTALNHFKEAADGNYLPAYLFLYILGDEIKEKQENLNDSASLTRYYQIIRQNLSWFITEAKEGNIEALFCLYVLWDTFRLEDMLKELGAVEQNYLKLAADKGHISAKWRLGQRLYQNKDKAEAFTHVKEAASLENAAAQVQLATWYYVGDNAEKNFKTAAKLFANAALQGHPEGQYYYALCCQEGKGVEKDEIKSINFFRLAANQGHPQAAYFIGCQHDANTDPKSALNYYKIAADNGHIEAQFLLATAYHEGNDLNRDYKKALHYYQMAALQNHPEAQYWTGHFYDHSIVEIESTQDKTSKALKYYKLSAEQGNPNGLYALGVYYEYGLIKDEINMEAAFNCYYQAAKKGSLSAKRAAGRILFTHQNSDLRHEISEDDILYYKACYLFHVKKDYEQAFKFYQATADKTKLADAEYWIAYCYEYGLGTQKNQTESLKYYQFAANQNHTEALCKLGEHSAKESETRSFEYYLKAAQLNNANAQYIVGTCYQTGKGVNSNYDEAFKYYSLAAKQKLSIAQYHVGYAFMNGLGVSIDLQSAFHFFMLSAKQDEPLAKLMLGKCYENAWGVDANNEQAEKFYQEAAAQGIERSIAEKYDFLGKKARKKYLDGQVTSPNAQELNNLYWNAILTGDSNAFLQLGKYYFFGIGAAVQNYDTALEYFQRASDKNPEALYMLGFYYLHGINSCEPDLNFAISCYKRAEQMGCMNAMAALAQCYYEGVDDDDNLILEKNIPEAAYRGHERAQYELGLSYELGTERTQDFEKAFEWYHAAKKKNIYLTDEHYSEFIKKLSDYRQKHGFYYYNRPKPSNISQSTWKIHLKADAGDLPSQIFLMKRYLTPKRILVNDKLALRYAELATRHGNPRAEYILACLFLNGWGHGKSNNAAQLYLKRATAKNYKPASDLLQKLTQGGQNTEDLNVILNVLKQDCNTIQPKNSSSLATQNEHKPSKNKANNHSYFLGNNPSSKFSYRRKATSGKRIFVSARSTLSASDGTGTNSNSNESPSNPKLSSSSPSNITH